MTSAPAAPAPFDSRKPNIAPAAPARTLLLLSGILSSVLYVVANIAGAMWSSGYSLSAQTISELLAIGAPSRPLLVPLFLLYSLLLFSFGWGVLQSATRSRALRVAAVCLMASAVLGLLGPLTPMHLRAYEGTLMAPLHLVLTAAVVVLILLAIGFAATALGPLFRLYSVTTALVFVVFGALTALEGARLAAQHATPWIGLTERISVGAFLLWIAVLAAALLRAHLDSDVATGRESPSGA